MAFQCSSFGRHPRVCLPLTGAPRRRRRRPKKNISTGSNCKESPSYEERSAPAASSSTAATPAPDAHPAAIGVLPSKDVELDSPSGDEVGNTLAGCSTTDVPPVHPLSDTHPDPADGELSSAEDVDSSTESIDLNTCDSVALDVRDVPEVSYVKDGVAGWTPVVRKHRLRKRKASHRSSASSSIDYDINLSCCEADISQAPRVTRNCYYKTCWWIACVDPSRGKDSFKT